MVKKIFEKIYFLLIDIFFKIACGIYGVLRMIKYNPFVNQNIFTYIFMGICVLFAIVAIIFAR